jgi:hypothetical protein
LSSHDEQYTSFAAVGSRCRVVLYACLIRHCSATSRPRSEREFALDRELELERSSRDSLLTSSSSLVSTSTRRERAPIQPSSWKQSTSPRAANIMPPDRHQRGERSHGSRALTPSQPTRYRSPVDFAALPKLACQRPSPRPCINHELVEALKPLRDERFLLYGSKSSLSSILRKNTVAIYLSTELYMVVVQALADDLLQPSTRRPSAMLLAFLASSAALTRSRPSSKLEPCTRLGRSSSSRSRSLSRPARFRSRVSTKSENVDRALEADFSVFRCSRHPGGTSLQRSQGADHPSRPRCAPCGSLSRLGDA